MKWHASDVVKVTMRDEQGLLEDGTLGAPPDIKCNLCTWHDDAGLLNKGEHHSISA
jgi:hypothetical protein